jgi:hypothetical protein
MEFAKVLGKVIVADMNNGEMKLNKLKDLIRTYTGRMNSLPLLSTIRSAA